MPHSDVCRARVGEFMVCLQLDAHDWKFVHASVDDRNEMKTKSKRGTTKTETTQLKPCHSATPAQHNHNTNIFMFRHHWQICWVPAERDNHLSVERFIVKNVHGHLLHGYVWRMYKYVSVSFMPLTCARTPSHVGSLSGAAHLLSDNAG